jgi:hypothetical protein
MMIGYIMFLASTNPQVRYGATFLIASGAFAFGALCNANSSANVVSDTARASAIGKCLKYLIQGRCMLTEYLQAPLSCSATSVG